MSLEPISFYDGGFRVDHQKELRGGIEGALVYELLKNSFCFRVWWDRVLAGFSESASQSSLVVFLLADNDDKVFSSIDRYTL